MSMVFAPIPTSTTATSTRSPLGPLGMNARAPRAPSRRSARLSGEDSHDHDRRATGEVQSSEQVENNERNAAADGMVMGKRKTRAAPTAATNGTAGSASETQLESAVNGKKGKRKVYEQEVDGFTFTKKRARPSKEPAVRPATADKTASPTKSAPLAIPQAPLTQQQQQPPAQEKSDAQTNEKRTRRRLPTTPERDTSKAPVRRSKRLSNENNEPQQPSPHKPAHAQSHINHERSPSPKHARPVTIEKKRRKGAEITEDQKVMRIQLPFQDTPVIRRNKEMRKSTVDGGSRRSSSGMRGRRASSMIDEGRGNALPHAEVSSSEFYKHISADIIEPNRMRYLLGWCGTRALPPKPDAPKDNSPASNLEFQALQAARVIQEELSQDLITKSVLSNWYTREDGPPPPVTLRKQPNPRNIANAAKAEELEKELERLKAEKAEWDAVKASASTSAPTTFSSEVDNNSNNNNKPNDDENNPNGSLSPLNIHLLDSPQKAIHTSLFQSTSPSSSTPTSTSLSQIESRLRSITSTLEFSVDQFAHGVHALRATSDTADRLADRTLADAADLLARRDLDHHRRQGVSDDNNNNHSGGGGGSSSSSKVVTGGAAAAPGVDPMVALRGLARVLNARQQQHSSSEHQQQQQQQQQRRRL